MASIIMPKMGDAMEEGVIVQFLKNVGDKVGPDDAVFEIETDKSNVEVPAGEAGYLVEIKHGAGATVAVGQVVAVIGATPPAAGASTAPTAIDAPKAAATPAPVEVVTEAVKSVAAPAAPQPVVVASDGSFRPYGDTYVGLLPENLGGSASVLSEPITVDGGMVSSGRVKASPLAKAIAAANGVNLSALGVDGTITAADVQAALSKPVAPATVAPSVASAPSVEVHEYNAMRRTIAKRLAESKSTIPHFYVTVEIDMENLLSLREQVNAGAGEGHPKVTVNDCIIRAVAVALKENPIVNSKFDDNKRIVNHALNIGFAVSLADGLIVPVVKNCESLSLRGIAAATKPLVDKARAGKLVPGDYTGGTFTISNLGAMADVENFAAIINPGEGAILAVAGTRSVPAVVNGQIVARKRMKVTLSGDHRVVDGADGAKFCLSLKRIVENPLEMLV